MCNWVVVLSGCPPPHTPTQSVILHIPTTHIHNSLVDLLDLFPRLDGSRRHQKREEMLICGMGPSVKRMCCQFEGRSNEVRLRYRNADSTKERRSVGQATTSNYAGHKCGLPNHVWLPTKVAEVVNNLASANNCITFLSKAGKRLTNFDRLSGIRRGGQGDLHQREISFISKGSSEGNYPLLVSMMKSNGHAIAHPRHHGPNPCWPCWPWFHLPSKPPQPCSVIQVRLLIWM